MPLKGALYRRLQGWKEKRKVLKGQEREAKAVFEKEYLQQRGKSLVARARERARKKIYGGFSERHPTLGAVSSAAKTTGRGFSIMGKGLGRMSDELGKRGRGGDDVIFGGMGGMGISDEEVLGFGGMGGPRGRPHRKKKYHKRAKRAKKRRVVIYV